MTVSAEESVATAKAFVEKDITDNKVRYDDFDI
jgi:hypothetical protein